MTLLLFNAGKLLGEKDQKISELDEKLAAANLTKQDRETGGGNFGAAWGD